MTIDPTRKEWQAAYERVRIAYLNRSEAHGLTAAALGPCPPEPARPSSHLDQRVRVLVERLRFAGVDPPHPLALTPDEADAMACSLIEHAAYVREQGATPSRNAPVAGPLIPAPICGRGPNCQRPKGHAGICSSSQVAGDDDQPICGFMFAGPGAMPRASACQRPKGHPGVCSSEERTAPKVAPQPL